MRRSIMLKFARYFGIIGLVLLIIAAGLTRGDDDQPSAAKPITYQDVRKLLENKTDEQGILQQLEKSPTIFTLDARQVDELKKAGASEKLLQALAGKRTGTASSGDITDFAIIL